MISPITKGIKLVTLVKPIQSGLILYSNNKNKIQYKNTNNIILKFKTNNEGNVVIN